MADNPPEPPPKAKPPSSPGGLTGRLKVTSNRLPSAQPGRTGKVVVMLSSVAKPTVSQQIAAPPRPTPLPQPNQSKAVPIQPTAPAPTAPPRVALPLNPSILTTAPLRPPPLPGKKVMPNAAPLPLEQRNPSTTFVKLPPKTTTPSLPSLETKTAAPSDKADTAKVAPALLPPKRAETSELPKVAAKESSLPTAPVSPHAAPAPPSTAGSPLTASSSLTAPASSSRGELRRTGPIKLNILPPSAPVEETDSLFVQGPGSPATTPAPAARDKQSGPLPAIIPPAPPLASRATPPPAVEPPIVTAKPVPVAAPSPASRDRKTGPVPSTIPSATIPPAAPPIVSPGAPSPAVEPPALTAKTEPVLNPAPVSLPPSAGVSAHPIQVAPPLTEKAHEEPAAKLPQPHLPDAASSPGTELHKAPPLLEPEKTPAKPPALPPPLPPTKPKESTPPRATGPVKLDTTTKFFVPPATEGKPALRPAVLPSRALRGPVDSPATEPGTPNESASPAAKVDPKPEPPKVIEARPADMEWKVGYIPPPAQTGGITPPPLEAKPDVAAAKAGPVQPPAEKAPTPAVVPVESLAAKPPPLEARPDSAPKSDPKVDPKVEPVKESKVVLPVNQPLTESESTSATAKAAVVTGLAGAAAAAIETLREKKPPLPPTRVERSRSRRQRGVILFWILVPFVAALLYFGILYFGRDTRVEGQVIPPPGMALADEVWIVSDFSSLAAGVADDDAKERVPLQLAIQEAQDHVQRVQADIAAREERIRLIQEDVQSAKDEITALVKKAQADAQAIYDNEGRELDGEYNDKQAALGRTIADRAASLKLTYQPDPAFPSPEVWANAYRLALYQTPPGVDGTKEHQWIADQMKQWRDFQKSMDDRYEQMREEAAATKQGVGPKIADLNNKMTDLNSRIAGTQGEEEPLKAELKQAEDDLAQAQGAESGLDDKYYSELNSLPAENISYHIPLQPDGRFTWIPDSPFGEGEIEHNYTIFARAIRADGRQYWSLHEFTMRKNETTELVLEPGGFESTKQILRPNLSPDEIEQ